MTPTVVKADKGSDTYPHAFYLFKVLIGRKALNFELALSLKQNISFASRITETHGHRGQVLLLLNQWYY